MSEILNALTNGIGKDLGVDIRRSYYTLSKIIHADESVSTYGKEFHQFIDDILCLCIYNQKVILPIGGAVSFKRGTEVYGINKIRMSTKTYDKEEIEKLYKIHTQFFALTKKYQLSLESLVYSSKKDFIEFWSSYYYAYHE